MKLDEFRKEMTEFRRAANEEAMLLKESYIAIKRLQALYQRFDAEERTMADQVIAEWVLSDDENIRFDAELLINHFQIKTAIPALRELAARLPSTCTPGAPYELQKVDRLIRKLSSKSE
jgi:hypothetical protein